MGHVSVSMAPSDGNICLTTITSKNYRWLIPSLTAIVSMSMSQLITSMALSLGDDDTIDDASMADP
jgi:hypothetical protein